MRDVKFRWIALVFGLLLPVTTGCSSSFRTTSESETVSLPEPKIFDQVQAIPALDVRIKKLRFFASGPSDIAPLKNPVYKSRFESAATTWVHPEIHIEYPAPGKKVYFNLTVHIRQNGNTFRIVQSQGRLEPEWTSSYHSVGIGVLGRGNWRVGKYDVEINKIVLCIDEIRQINNRIWKFIRDNSYPC
jgi:hypothetical protein